MTGLTAHERALLAGFADGSLEDFHHRDHLHLAWLYLQQESTPRAIERFCADLQRFAAAKGSPHLFHVTITWAFLLIMSDRMARSPQTTWGDFARENPDLLTWKPSVLDRYYHAATLWSARAREAFVWPDRGFERGPAGVQERTGTTHV